MADPDYTTDSQTRFSRLSQLGQQFTAALILEDVAAQAAIRAEFVPLYNLHQAETVAPAPTGFPPRAAR